MTDHDLDLTAHHEAGHAIAAVMRGGSSLRSVTIDLNQPGHGLTLHRSAPWDFGFIAYAGPWAEARFLWGERPFDERDEDDCDFSDYVVGVLVNQPDDAAVWRAWRNDPVQVAVRREMDRHGLDSQPEDIWHYELESVWPQIQTLAHRIRAGEAVTDDEVRELKDAA
ncbi:M50 family metallopeptidase [Tsukamurella paurometabola]|uniref:ATP-dependent zinc metalloprotease FtsH n=1 Tax=Tsukamurella paurometabola TaxID=2061 RepID=A0A3P8L4M1_TSUPA|nr:M50 family metallopeptidase [Tsukamurella paurometabola]UEA83300.1 M50 family metallopeptidase [Tsukamurella paurometabola]VDR40405.1 Uncharacterised protein [Tsukamurella paurometabola]